MDGDADVIKQMRLSAINEGTGVHGQDLIERWRLRSTRYPRILAVAVAASYLTAEQLGAWRQWRASSALALAKLIDETVQLVRAEIPEVNLSDVSTALDRVR